MQIFCDFDGTVSVKDTTDEMLSRFAAKEWEHIEQEWKNGAIGSAECMRRQVALIRAGRQELDDALDCQDIDPSFPPFVHVCEALGIPVTILSDGVDYFIRRILARCQLQHLPVIANHLAMDPPSFALSSPYANPACESAAGVCKCRQIGAHPGTSIFIGDGRSDFCAAGEADLVFAKSTLAVYCEQQNIPYLPYRDFSDVAQALKREFPAIMGRTPALAAAAFT